MSALDDSIALACNIAPDYYAKNKSPYALLQASGYCDHRDAIDVEKIKSYVAANPELVGRWIGYSESKRVDSGWYFSVDTPSGPFVVGYFPVTQSAPRRALQMAPKHVQSSSSMNSNPSPHEERG